MTSTLDPETTPEEPAVADRASGADNGAASEVDDLQTVVRVAVSVAFPVIAAAVMVGGMFLGFSPRFYAGFAGIFGVVLAVAVSRVARPVVANLLVAGGLFAIGLLMLVPTGPTDIPSAGNLAANAAASGDVLRPPVPWTPGWQAIVGWLLGTLGFAATWIAVVVKRPSLALLVPLPVAAVGGISVPAAAQVPSGLAVLVLFAIGLGLLSSSQSLGEGEERPPLSYEIRKAVKSLPLLAAITVALTLLAQADFLFPDPFIDPAQEAQRPRTQPLSEVEDRVLFEVEAEIAGPWRTGSLDVFDGEYWRLAPFAESSLNEVPRSGVVDSELKPGVKARFSIAGLTGAVLPGLPNPVGIVAEGPRLSYDDRNDNIRVAQGQVRAGLAYTVTAAALPSVEDLENVAVSAPREVRQFTEIPIDPPPAALALIRDAPKTSKWAEFDFLRTHILDNVVATGTGVPKRIDGARVQDMLAGSKEGSPYEIVAAQAMFARWIGVPSRIGYGYDGGDLINGRLQVRPKHGATFVEVYFPGYKWLPVIGTPKQAKPTVGGDPSTQQFDASVLPSQDITVQLILPTVVEPASVVGDQIRQAVAITVAVLLFLALLYLLWPLAYKAWIRSRRRKAAIEAGPRARVALAYAEWRDYCTDFGFRYSTDTPLMFLDRFMDDDEHTEFAWLITRAMWGDLQHDLTPEVVTGAEELSRALRRRLAQAQPITVRFVAAVSRLSMQHPYAPETDLSKREVQRDRRAVDRDRADEEEDMSGELATV